jgi:hypothetical protein
MPLNLLLQCYYFCYNPICNLYCIHNNRESAKLIMFLLDPLLSRIKQFCTNVCYIRGLLEKYPTFGREKETGLLGALDT